jgi:hypothetical protein
MRLIDADALHDHIYALYRTKEQVQGLEIDEHLILLTIENTSTIDAVPVKRGRWIAFMEMDFFTILDGLKCSICGSKHNPELATEYRYCPDCGAKMEDV